MGNEYKPLHKNALDITDNVFSEWTVLGYKGNSMWECRCSCGNIKDVASKTLRNGDTKSCGHSTKNANHIVGKTYGEWKVLEHAGYKNNRHYWKCECSCGTIAIKDAFTLTSGHSKSCGHDRLLDMVGKVFGDLLVLEYAGDKKWKCMCSCGVEKVILGKELRNGAVVSCGDGVHKIIDLHDKTFGELTAKTYAGHPSWNCECLCGKECVVATKHLLSGERQTCGHAATNKLIDLTGLKVGELTVLQYSGNRQWKCSCSCGNETYVGSQALRQGMIRSCGCKKKQFIRETLLERYGETATARILNPREPWQIETVESKEKMEIYLDSLGYIPTSFELSQMLDTDKNVLLKKIHTYELEDKINIRPFYSQGEKEVCDYVQSLIPNEEVLANYRGISGVTELDIYIPNRKIGIEFNGTYWHSTENKHMKYHQEKTIACAKQGIRLIHIFEYDWNDELKRKKLKALISDILTENKVVYGRNTVVREITTLEATEFLNEYHIQNSTPASVNIGLLLKSELVAVMTFGKPRFNNNFEWELIRLCFKTGISIVGGIEKLFKLFADKYKPSNIISYCDISKFTGGSYVKIGFKTSVVDITQPNYVWVNTKTNKVLTRYQTQKSSLIKQGLGGETETETEIMSNLGYFRIYDCGNLKLTW